MTTEKTNPVSVIMRNSEKQKLNIIIAKQGLKGGFSGLARKLLQNYIEQHKDLV